VTGTPATQPATFRVRADVDAYLERLTRFGIKLGLDTISSLLAKLGNPQRNYPSIHIAGTNGKGSTAAFLDALLLGFGQRTGRYTSPHLEDFRERICVAGEPISDADLLRVAERVARVVPMFPEAPPPTFFEVTTAMAMDHFAHLPTGGTTVLAGKPVGGPAGGPENPVDVAVVETGLGGRLDATNVLVPRVCIVTGVSLEHTEHLGRDLASIAEEKAGILKPGIPVVTAASGVALEVIRRRAAQVDAPLYVHGADFGLMGDGDSLHWRGLRTNYTGLTLGLAGAHQRTNAALALAALELYLPAGVAMAEGAVRRALRHTHWPGRLEMIGDAPPLLLDAAHNPEAAHALAAFLASWQGDRPLWLVLGVLADKDFESLLAPLAEHISHLVLTAPDTPRRGDLQAQAEVARPLCPDVMAVPQVGDAVSRAVAAAREAGGRVCVTGSIYTLGEARAALRRAGMLPPSVSPCVP